jgi:probable phosphoglycerate mutase
MGSVRLLLARHGQTEWHHDNRYAGRTDVELTETGRGEAQALARRAREEASVLVVCSSLHRALDTASVAAEACGVELQIEDRLREIDFGDWEGRTLDEVRETNPAAVEQFEQNPGERPFPQGEPLPVATERALEAFYELHKKFEDRTVLVVAHNTLIRLSLCSLLGIPLEQYRKRFPQLYNVAIHEVHLGDTGGSLHTLNDSRHLRHSDPP